MATPTTLPLFDRRITITSAEGYDDDLIGRVDREAATNRLLDALAGRQAEIASVVAAHVGVDSARCVVQERRAWLHGSFNVCVPVRVLGGDGRTAARRVVVRCPLRHKLGEDRHLGTVDEKIGVEAATYIWMRRHCPEVPIPGLLGFGFVDGRYVRAFPYHPCFCTGTRRPLLMFWLPG